MIHFNFSWACVQCPATGHVVSQDQIQICPACRGLVWYRPYTAQGPHQTAQHTAQIGDGRSFALPLREVRREDRDRYREQDYGRYYQDDDDYYRRRRSPSPRRSRYDDYDDGHNRRGSYNERSRYHDDDRRDRYSREYRRIRSPGPRRSQHPDSLGGGSRDILPYDSMSNRPTESVQSSIHAAAQKQKEADKVKTEPAQKSGKGKGKGKASLETRSMKGLLPAIQDTSDLSSPRWCLQHNRPGHWDGECPEKHKYGNLFRNEISVCTLTPSTVPETFREDGPVVPQTLGDHFLDVYRLYWTLFAYKAFLDNRKPILAFIDSELGVNTDAEHKNLRSMWRKTMAIANNITADIVTELIAQMKIITARIFVAVRPSLDKLPLARPDHVSKSAYAAGRLIIMAEAMPDILPAFDPSMHSLYREYLIDQIDQHKEAKQRLHYDVVDYLNGSAFLRDHPNAAWYKSAFDFVVNAQVQFNKIRGQVSLRSKILWWPQLLPDAQALGFTAVLPVPKAEEDQYRRHCQSRHVAFVLDEDQSESTQTNKHTDNGGQTNLQDGSAGDQASAGTSAPVDKEVEMAHVVNKPVKSTNVDTEQTSDTSESRAKEQEDEEEEELVEDSTEYGSSGDDSDYELRA